MPGLAGLGDTQVGGCGAGVYQGGGRGGGGGLGGRVSVFDMSSCISLSSVTTPPPAPPLHSLHFLSRRPLQTHPRSVMLWRKLWRVTQS